MDLFDSKEFIQRKHGQTIESPLAKTLLQVGTDKFLALGTSVPIRPRGESGMLISDLMPHLASVADDLCLLRGMNADNPQHMPAELQLHTVRSMMCGPPWAPGSVTAWGPRTGTCRASSPSIRTPTSATTVRPGSRRRIRGRGVVAPLDDKTLPDREPPGPVAERRRPAGRISLMQKMNRRLVGRLEQDAAMEGMIESMELAFRMQTTTPAPRRSFTRVRGHGWRSTGSGRRRRSGTGERACWPGS